MDEGKLLLVSICPFLFVHLGSIGAYVPAQFQFYVYNVFSSYWFPPVSLVSRKGVSRYFSASATPGIRAPREITPVALEDPPQSPSKSDGRSSDTAGDCCFVSLRRPYINLGKPSFGWLRRPFVSFRIPSFLQELTFVADFLNAINDFLYIINDMEMAILLQCFFSRFKCIICLS